MANILLRISDIAALRAEIRKQRATGRRIGLVPTMGNLHAGHLKLVEQAKQQCDWVVSSIFVNPMQFGPGEDLDAYPRTLEQDIVALEKQGCHCLFHPDANTIYPHGLQKQTVVSVPELGMAYCGKSRPGHFDGVTTVVSKLFNICQPDIAFFGLKDYQQFLIIRKMVDDLMFPIEMVGVETVREPDGLAMSSRNNYLTVEQRRCAPALFRTLQETRARIESGDRDFPTLEQAARDHLSEAGLKPDYFAICHANTLQPAQPEDDELAILAAAFLGSTRIIDNTRFSASAGDR